MRVTTRLEYSFILILIKLEKALSYLRDLRYGDSKRQLLYTIGFRVMKEKNLNTDFLFTIRNKVTVLIWRCCLLLIQTISVIKQKSWLKHLLCSLNHRLNNTFWVRTSCGSRSHQWRIQNLLCGDGGYCNPRGFGGNLKNDLYSILKHFEPPRANRTCYILNTKGEIFIFIYIFAWNLSY